jgi:hypothetical protein
MITIVTGDNNTIISKFKADYKDHSVVFTDEHPRDLISQSRQLVKKHGDDMLNLYVFTYNITVIQALLYFSRIYKKPMPEVRFCTEDGWGVEKDLEKVFSNLVAPLDDLFLGMCKEGD